MNLSGVKRDEKSNAIVNIDHSSLAAYKAARSRDNKINSYIQKVDELNEDVKEIMYTLSVFTNMGIV